MLPEGAGESVDHTLNPARGSISAGRRHDRVYSTNLSRSRAVVCGRRRNDLVVIEIADPMRSASWSRRTVPT